MEATAGGATALRIQVTGRWGGPAAPRSAHRRALVLGRV